MKPIPRIVLFLLIPFLAQAQDENSLTDSLKTALKNAPNDTVRMDTHFSLGKFYATVNLDSSIWHLNKALSLSEDLQLEGSAIPILDWLGYVYTISNNYPKALKTLEKGIAIAEDSETEKKLLTSSGKSISKKERRKGLLTMYNRLGELYGRIGNNSEQYYYLLKARNIAVVAGDSLSIQFSDINFASFYLEEGKLDSALIFAKHARTIDDLMGKTRDPYMSMLMGQIYLQKGDFITSRFYLQQGLELSSNRAYDDYSAGLNFSLAELYHSYSSQDSALFYAKNASDLYSESQYYDELNRTYALISKIYEKIGITDTALVYLKRSAVLSDSLNNAEKKNLMSFQNMGFDQQLKVQELEKEKILVQSRFRSYSLLGGIAISLIIASLLFRNNRNRKKANAILGEQNKKIEEQKKDVEETLLDLKSTQAQLIQSEKMASLGELTAGIAHEIQNPLNFVNNFSEVSNELMDEMTEEMSKGELEEAKEIAADIKQNLEKITHHGKRADSIVKGMLAHSRAGKGEKEPTDINALAEEYLKLSYHGLRAKDKSFNADFKTDFDPNLPKVNVVPQDIGRVLLNLINNAFQAVNEKNKRGEPDYAPIVSITTQLTANGQQLIAIKDNGLGIPDSIKDKIFQPFFTTKPTGEGTGLGLSLSYDIVKAHGGELNCSSTTENGTEFIIKLPHNS